jgi:hypothetical protein
MILFSSSLTVEKDKQYKVETEAERLNDSQKERVCERQRERQTTDGDEERQRKTK